MAVLRSVRVRRADGSIQTLRGIEEIEIVFGAAYAIVVSQDEFSCTSTHHGVRLPTTSIAGSSLDAALYRIREAMPESVIDEMPRLREDGHGG